MILEPIQILFVLRLPALLTVNQVAILLGLHPDIICHLVNIGLLEAVGETKDVQLVFNAECIDDLRHNARWLTKAKNAGRAFTREKNKKQTAKKKARA